jgi:hypothetical protein
VCGGRGKITGDEPGASTRSFPQYLDVPFPHAKEPPFLAALSRHSRSASGCGAPTLGIRHGQQRNGGIRRGSLHGHTMKLRDHSSLRFSLRKSSSSTCCGHLRQRSHYHAMRPAVAHAIDRRQCASSGDTVLHFETSISANTSPSETSA